MLNAPGVEYRDQTVCSKGDQYLSRVHPDFVFGQHVRGKCCNDVDPPPPLWYENQRAEEDNVWRPEWSEDPIRQCADLEGRQRPQVIGDGNQRWRNEALQGPWN